MTALQSETRDDAHHVVVVGGGFGGLQAIKSLKGSGTRITLIDRRNHHLFQPLLYQAATTILAPSEIAWPLRHVLRSRPDVTTLMAKVMDVDTETRQVWLGDGTFVTYDTLILATGARHSYFGNDHWEEHAPGLKTLEDATKIRRRILAAFEAAEKCDDEVERRALLTFAVIGAGPTGVELAGIIAELAKRVLPRDFRRIDTREARVMLIEAGPRVLAGFPEELSSYAAKTLERLGVELRLGAKVTECHSDAVDIGLDSVPCHTIIWAAGVQASRAGKWIRADADKAGRVLVAPDLSVPERPEIFVIGDTAAVDRADGRPVPGVAPAAKQMGAHVAKVIKARLAGGTLPAPFAYKDMGNMATLGRRAAIADFGGYKMKGVLAWWIWGVAHIYFLIGTRSRAVVAWSWMWSYVTGQNSARIITQPEDGKPQ
ncbi:NAD(P)/FAD-dependent oxidoreductase [Alphaproteobacteria bacterium KMM 3653]|uniref:NADH:ubiquinone reductase (non-electrogenic) n=1 Tax=Harenicola maris TaxID=2841044 RepID=A0AAP2CSI8_9RHOB|nr:NAD(P)/FAD-dependent oxidoreductase [Harenicola maris]